MADTDKKGERSPFSQRLLDARKAAGLTQLEVSARLGIKQSTIATLERNQESSTFTAQLAQLYGVDAFYLATGQGKPATSHIAHTVSYQIPIISPKIYSKEDLMREEPKEEIFGFKICDDSMAPKYRKGRILLFNRSVNPKIGGTVLCKDDSGEVFVRVHTESDNGFAGSPLNSAFKTLSKNSTGYTIIASFYGSWGEEEF